MALLTLADLGQLFLGVFSGPVEGILMIVGIYVLSGLYGKRSNFHIVFDVHPPKGPSFWDTGILTFTGLNKVPMVAQLLPNIGLNEAFMVFAGFGLAFNIQTRYAHCLYSATALI
jgi:ethanolaminephosphotransferase